MSLKSVKNLWRHLFAPLVVLITASGLQGVQPEKDREEKVREERRRFCSIVATNTLHHMLIHMVRTDIISVIFLASITPT
jgi:hypothetical protein